MIKTRGLTHIHLMVNDLQRSLEFYQKVFGMTERFRIGSSMIFLNTAGSNDVITLHQIDPATPSSQQPGSSGGILHFGFELESKADLDEAIRQVIAEGGALKKRGEFFPGMPFAYVSDPDGYEIEL